MKILSNLIAFGAATALSLSTTFVVPAYPAAAIPVFDASNYAQNLLQAARTLQQVNQQIQSLQNEAAMLGNMARNLERIDFPQLQRIEGTLRKIDGLMAKAEGIDFSVEKMDERFRSLFPESFDAAVQTDQRVAQARARLDQAMASFRHAMTVQSQVVENVQADAAILSELVAKSQGAEGSLQAQQATNQLLALAAKQQLQLQALMAAEFRGQTIERARRVQAEAEARAAARRFLGSGTAYTPD